ncbi:hypothetical protein ACFOYU_17995 [Microvirga sp. GCM10011540]|uniref:hypothetical protein n=1 Tax=Microvirga sp. GCM10011540 TaxID=3317338 RepID=UPI00360F612C
MARSRTTASMAKASITERSEQEFHEELALEIERMEDEPTLYANNLRVLRRITLTGWRDAIATMARAGVNH